MNHFIYFDLPSILDNSFIECLFGYTEFIFRIQNNLNFFDLPLILDNHFVECVGIQNEFSENKCKQNLEKVPVVVYFE